MQHSEEIPLYLNVIQNYNANQNTFYLPIIGVNLIKEERNLNFSSSFIYPKEVIENKFGFCIEKAFLKQIQNEFVFYITVDNETFSFEASLSNSEVRKLHPVV